MSELGLIGFGAFGQFLARQLSPFFQITAYDPRGVNSSGELPVKEGSLEDVAGKDAVVLAVPVQSMQDMLREIAPLLKPDATVIDVSSVKIKPVEWMLEILPETVDIIATHPLFGPQSGKNGIRGLRIVVCPVRGERVQQAKMFFSDHLGLKIIECTPDEHDREIAFVQSLTHFLSRGVREMGLHVSEMATPAYEHLLAIGDILKSDSDELFKTIQCANPYAKEKREIFLTTLKSIHGRIEN